MYPQTGRIIREEFLNLPKEGRAALEVVHVLISPPAITLEWCEAQVWSREKELQHRQLRRARIRHRSETGLHKRRIEVVKEVPDVAVLPWKSPFRPIDADSDAARLA